MTRFLTLDSWYPAAYKAAGSRSASYRDLFNFCHGTADYLDIVLRGAGHEADTLISNHEDDVIGLGILHSAEMIDPDVICSQNVGLWSGSLLRERFPRAKLVAFCSYAVDDANLRGYDVVFSSFPWMPEHCRALGIRCEYLPLAFGRPVLERVPAPPERDLPLTFIGGLGERIWKRGTETMAAVARAFPDDFKWWGYRAGRVPAELERVYQGEVYGAEYFRLLMRSRITLNRHGEVARGFGNAMRQYEALGCGAMLLTDDAGELEGVAIIYQDADDLAVTVRNARKHDAASAEGQFGKEEVLENHCYENRVPRFLEVIERL